MRSRLDRVSIRGFKSIERLENLTFRPLTVLIGPNGAGKSNLVSFFRMISWALEDSRHFATYVSNRGGARNFLHDGPDHTRVIQAEIIIRTHLGNDEYAFRLEYAAENRFTFAEESYRFSFTGFPTPSQRFTIGEGHAAPRLQDARTPTARAICGFFRGIVAYQFHDTSDDASVRTGSGLHDDRVLHENGANVASILYRLRRADNPAYGRITDTLRLALPFLSDFELEPEGESILLRWRERNSAELFGASQASDGMLRLVSLVTLLLQPEEDLPDVLILDEPELGLHPYAIELIGGLISAAATKIQVIVATQSTALMDCFEPDDVVVVERAGRGSAFSRLSADDLHAWLEDYSLSELWEKNVFGGRP